MAQVLLESVQVAAILDEPGRKRMPATTVPPYRSAIATASSGVVATSPGGTGMPDARRISLAWYSWMFMRYFFNSLLVRGTDGKSLEEGPEFVERLSESLKITSP